MDAQPHSRVPDALETANNVPARNAVEPIPQPRHLCEQPRQVLVLLTAFFAATFVDRGVIATNAINGSGDVEEEEDSTGLRGDMRMSNLKNGLLASALIVGLLAGAAVTSLALSKLPPLPTIGLGMLLWCGAALGCGLASNFHWLVTCRFVVGIGQYPISFLGSIILYEIAPELHGMQWLTFYLLSAPVGLAFGFFLGPTVVEYFDWRYAFFIEAGAVMPLTLLCFYMKPFYLRRWTRGNNSQEVAVQNRVVYSWSNLKRLLTYKAFNLTVLGGALHMGFVMIMEYWGARMTKSLFDENTVDLYQGAFMAVGTISGCLLGGFALQLFSSSLSAALYLSSASCFAASAIVIVMVLRVNQYTPFMALLLTTSAALSFLQGPLSGAALWSVPHDLRPLSRDFHQIVQHVVIAAPAPMLYGMSLDVLDNHYDLDDSHKMALSSSTILLLAAAAFFFTSGCIGMKRADDQNDEHRDIATVV